MSIRRIAFVSPCSLIDHASGAAIATWRGLQVLCEAGFQCQAFCAAALDAREEVCFEQTLADLKLPYDVQMSSGPGGRLKLVFTRLGSVPVTVFRNQLTQLGPTPEVSGFLAAYEQFLQANRPDVIVTYGGGALGDALIGRAKAFGIPVVFWVHNFAYLDPRAFAKVDYIIVPSEFSKEFYRERVGVECHVVPNVIEPARVLVSPHPVPLSPEGRGEASAHPSVFVTFVNPEPAKGVFVFARIAEQIAWRRPDITMLVVESRHRAKALERTGVDLSCAKNLFGMPNTTDPRKFYAVSKIILMPSVGNESFGLVAAEAMTNGIPVLASDRGALPEIVGEGGLLLNIPARYTPEATAVPTADEIEPWVDAIIRLWDDEAFYRHHSEKARRQAERWQPRRLRPLYADFFGNVRTQVRAPIVLSMDPYISVITPLYNGARTIERAVRSVMAQNLANWELLLVDDFSTDGSRGIAEALAAGDPRIRLIRKSENTGIGATRNVGLRAARGRLVTYLDQDDEYDPRYFERLADLDGKADVFIFGYDFVYDDEPNRPVERWRPEVVSNRLLAHNIVTPLGIAHRREWIDKVGELNELVWIDEDTDLLKRFARAGAKFVFLSERSGRYHLRQSSQSRTPKLNPRQQEAIERNWRAGKPIFGDPPPGLKAREIRKIAHVSSHGDLDSTRETATAASQSIGLLRSLGFCCHAFSGSQGDGSEEVSFLEQNRPDVLIHFGVNPIWDKLVVEAKTRDIPVVFWLHDLSCTDRSAVRPADYVLVPSESARRHYWETLGLACFALPNGKDAGQACREFFSNIFVQPGLPYIPTPICHRADKPTGTRRTHVFCPAIERPAGGVKKLYDLVDLLNARGFPAAIVHPVAGFRCRWFESQTPVYHTSQVAFGPDDLVVIPEMLGPRAADIAPGVKKLIFNQNAYYTFLEHSFDPNERTTPYTDHDVLGVMVVSQDNEEYVRHAFPGIRVWRYRLSIDPRLFSPQFPKKKQLCYMPRKNSGDALQVINLLKFRGALDGWTLKAIDGMSPPQIADVMRQSALFLSFGHPEGFSLPPAEAMACGCVVVGYHGQGAREYLRPEFSFPIPMGDILAFARTVEDLMREFGQSPERLEAIGRRASEFILAYCPLEQEASRIVAIWRELQDMMGRSYCYHFADRVVNEFSEFSGLSTAVIEENISRYRELACQEWQAVDGDGFDGKAASFYGQSRSYIYDLLGSNYRNQAVVEKLNRMHPGILQSIQTHPGRKFLEFGGGIGVMCQIAHELGKEVTYVDLPGLVADFAVWRFERHGWPIRVLLSDPRCLRLEDQYDIVFSDAVLEHVVDPDQVIRELCAHVAPGGLLVLLVDLSGPSDDRPMHRKIDIVATHDLIEQHGLRNTLGRHAFASVWSRNHGSLGSH